MYQLEYRSLVYPNSRKPHAKKKFPVTKFLFVIGKFSLIYLAYVNHNSRTLRHLRSNLPDKNPVC